MAISKIWTIIDVFISDDCFNHLAIKPVVAMYTIWRALYI